MQQGRSHNRGLRTSGHWWSTRAVARKTTYGTDHIACRATSQASIYGSLEMLAAGVCGTVRPAHRPEGRLHLLPQVDIGGSWNSRRRLLLLDRRHLSIA